MVLLRDGKLLHEATSVLLVVVVQQPNTAAAAAAAGLRLRLGLGLGRGGGRAFSSVTLKKRPFEKHGEGEQWQQRHRSESDVVSQIYGRRRHSSGYDGVEKGGIGSSRRDGGVVGVHAPAVGVDVVYNKRGKVLEVSFENGSVFKYPAEYLRMYSPAAQNQKSYINVHGKMDIRPLIVHGRRHVGIMELVPVGRYALQIHYDDLHRSGLYTWEYLYHLGENKYSKMKEYLRILREYGLSRDPKRK